MSKTDDEPLKSLGINSQLRKMLKAKFHALHKYTDGSGESTVTMPKSYDRRTTYTSANVKAKPESEKACIENKGVSRANTTIWIGQNHLLNVHSSVNFFRMCNTRLGITSSPLQTALKFRLWTYTVLTKRIVASRITQEFCIRTSSAQCL